MKALLIFSMLLHSLSNINAVVAEQSLSKEVNYNWSHSPLYERQDHDSKIKMKLFQRIIWSGKTPIQVAQTNFTYLSNPQDKVDLKKLGETMINSFPEGTLKSHPISNGIRLEGEWKQINRMLKIDILKKNNDFMSITTFYRPSMNLIFTKELEAFHSLLKTYEESKISKTSFVELLINSATAESLDLAGLTTLVSSYNPPSGTSGAGGATSSSSAGTNAATLLTGLSSGSTGTGMTDLGAGMTNLGTGLTNSGTGMTNLATSITPLSPAIENHAIATDNLATAIKEGTAAMTEQGNLANQTALQISQESNATINKQGDLANQTALTISKESNATITKQGDAFNANYAESNRIAALALSPEHMAKLAYYTAAGAALGALTVNLAVEGIAAGFSFLKEFFTGAKEKAIDWDKFQKATAAWDGQVNSLVNYEKVVDDLITSFDFFRGEKLNNDYLSNLTQTKLEMKFDEKEMLVLSDDKNLTKECRFKYYEIADFLHNKIDEYDKIIKFAKDQHLKIDDNQKYFCQQLAELKQRILQAEQQMADLRVAILKAERQFYDKSIENRDLREANVGDINSKMAKTLREQQKFDKENTEQLQDHEDKTRDDWIKVCIAKKNPEGKKVEEERLLAMKKGYFKYLMSFSFKKSCNSIYKSIHKAEKRDTEIQQNLASATKLRRGLEIDGNVNVDIALSEEQQKWFARIHMDAHCYQFAHGAEDLIPKECKEFPEMLSSLKLSKGADKASEAYKANCQSYYTQGLKKLAGR